MAYYDTFVKSSKSPKQDWHDSMQELVDQEFENASTYWEDIEEEDSFGSLKFHKIKARITSLIDAKSGQRINDDFKKIIFDNIDYHPLLGSRFRFDDNIWMVYSTENIRTDTASIYIRRCNNVMTTQDEYGNIHREPVYIDYKVTENQLTNEYTISVPNGRIQFWCQFNEHTKNIAVNDRYIFGLDVYKVRERSRYDRTKTFDENSMRMISFYAELDAVGNDDNLELGIANYKLYNYKISTIESISNIVGFTGHINNSVYLNEELIDEKVTWESTNNSIAKINDFGEYEFVGIGSCKFICKMVRKPDIYSIVNIDVVKNIKPSYEYFVTPTNFLVKQNKTIEYRITEYISGKETNASFDFNSVGISNKNYILTVTGKNSFAITNLRPSNDKLEIVCTSSSVDINTHLPIKYSIFIELGGIV